MLKSFLYATWVTATLGALMAIALANVAVSMLDGESSLGGRLFFRLLLSVWVAWPYGLWALFGRAIHHQGHAGLAITTHLNGLLASGFFISMAVSFTLNEPSEYALMFAVLMPPTHAGALVAVPGFVLMLVVLDEMENPK